MTQPIRKLLCDFDVSVLAVNCAFTALVLKQRLEQRVFVVLKSTGLGDFLLPLDKIILVLDDLAVHLNSLLSSSLQVLLLKLLGGNEVHVEVTSVVVLLNDHALLRDVFLVLQALALLQNGVHSLLHLQVTKLRDAEDVVVLRQVYFHWLLVA